MAFGESRPVAHNSRTVSWQIPRFNGTATSAPFTTCDVRIVDCVPSAETQSAKLAERPDVLTANNPGAEGTTLTGPDLVVPSAAVQRGPRGAYVYVINQENTASRRNVTVGHEDAQGSIITEGVQAGDKVVIDGASRLSDATKVTIVQPAAAGTAPTAGQPAAPGTKRRQSGGAG